MVFGNFSFNWFLSTAYLSHSSLKYLEMESYKNLLQQNRKA